MMSGPALRNRVIVTLDPVTRHESMLSFSPRSHVLISEPESKKMGLWLWEPNQFLHNALPRAEKYLANFNLESALT
jgi:hypothetical protein